MSPKKVNQECLDARELELINAALQIMETDGTSGLTMDKVVARVPYSKGTVYNHFCSKEDLLTGVCNTGMGRLADLFTRAASFKGTHRERMMAISYAYLLHALLDPTRFMLVVSAKTANLMERTSDDRLTKHRHLEGRLMGTMLELVNGAIESKALELPPHMTQQQIVFANWAGSFGPIALLISHEGDCSARDTLDLETEVINQSNLLLDGMNW